MADEAVVHCRQLCTRSERCAYHMLGRQRATDQRIHHYNLTQRMASQSSYLHARMYTKRFTIHLVSGSFE